MRKIHDTAQGYSSRTIQVKAYGDPVAMTAPYFYGGKMIVRKRRGYDGWVARMEEQFKLERAAIIAMPNHKLEWRTLEITIMLGTQHKVKWGRPRHESRTPVWLYVEPVIKALAVAQLWDKSQLANKLTVKRVYAPVSGVLVEIGVVMAAVEFNV